MNSITFTLVVLFAYSTMTCATDLENWEQTKVQALAAVETRDCAGAWNLVWPWARNGNVEARAILASGMVAVGLTPPGTHGDAITRFRHAWVLSAYGSANGDRAATEILYALIQSAGGLGIGGQNLKSCLDAGETHCVEDAVVNGFIPNFTDYAKELDILASSSGNPMASCDLPIGKLEISPVEKQPD